MATSTQGPLATTSHTTDAEWRFIAQKIHDALIGAGLVTTADTGQFDIATASRPTVASQRIGYKIYKWTDPLDNLQMFLKMEYGNSASADRFGFAATIGLGSDGAGNLTQATVRNANVMGVGTTGGTIYACATNGGFWICLPNNASTAFMLGALRVRDSDSGALRPHLLSFHQSGALQGFVWNPITLSWGTIIAFSPIFMELGSAVHIGGNATDVSMAPGLFYEGGFLRYVDAVSADPDDVTFGTPFAIELPDGIRTFFPIKGNFPSPSGTLAAYCFLWE